MDNKQKNFYIDKFLKKIENEAENKRIEEALEKFNLEKFNNASNKELTDFEKEIIYSYFQKDKSLKRIAQEQGYTYPYIRKIFITGKEKMRIILNLCTKE